MLTNTQPIIDSILASEPPRFIDPAVQAQLKQALMDDLGVDGTQADTILAGLIPILETLARNTALPLQPTPTAPPTTTPPG